MKYWLVFLVSFSAIAGPFQITNRNLGSNPALESQINTLFNQIETDVNAKLPNADQSNYLKGMANASVMSAKGMGTDYSNEIVFTQFKYTVGLGADLGAVGASDLIGGDVEIENIRGVGIQQAFMLGVDLSVFGAGKLGPIDFSKFELFLNYGHLSPSNYSSSLSGKIKSFGFHGRYRLVEKSEILPAGLLGFGGVFFHFGYEETSTELKVTTNTNYSKTESGLGTLTATGTAIVGADVKTHSFPLEFSTYFDWLAMMTTHFGLGIDFNFGKAKSIATLTSDITYDADATVSGTATLDLGQEGKPSSAFVRWFVGHQFHFSLLKVNLNVGHVPSTGLWNANVGALITY